MRSLSAHLTNKSASARPSAGQTALRWGPMEEELGSRKEPETLVSLRRWLLVKLRCTLTALNSRQRNNRRKNHNREVDMKRGVKPA
jgi:hypothetical protein